MVKQLNIILDDEDHAKLLIAKGETNWRDFIMRLTGELNPSQEGDAANDQEDKEVKK